MKKVLLMFLVLFSVAFSNVYAQGRKITGTVIGADDGQPLPGVSVSVKGTNRGTITDGNGKFTLNASTGETLTVTFIGYTTQSLPVTAGNDYQVKLGSDTKLLNEVVVADSYGVQSKKAYTGAAASVNGKENENKPFSTPLGALQGEVAGLNISSNSGQPGALEQVRLRGVGSISEGSNPLYVVDGVIIASGDFSRLVTTTNVLAGINSDDIESITVLKDASATAIYGSRGSNGVIVITTKKGKAGKTQIRFDTEIGSTENLPLPTAGQPLTGAQYSALSIEGITNAATTPAKVAALPTSIANEIATYGLNGPSNNWYPLVTRNGAQQQYNLSVSGGSESTKIFSSVGYFDQQATVIGSSLKRITGLLNIDHKISKRFTLNTSINISNVNQITPTDGGTFASPVLDAFFLRPEQIAYNANGTLNSNPVGNTNFNQLYNPLFIAQNDNHSDSETRGLGSTTLKWNIWDSLNFTSFVSGDFVDLEENIYNNPILGDGRGLGGRGENDYTRVFGYTVRNQLDYRYNIPKVEDFYVDATVGYESQNTGEYLISSSAQGYPVTQPLLTASANAATPTVGSSSFANITIASFYARASINFKNRFALSGSFRRDGDSIFGINNQYGSFYSVGGTWNIDQEDFFKTQKIFSSAKLRASNGTTGNAQFSNTNSINNAYIAQPTVSYGGVTPGLTNYNYNGGNGQNFSVIGNTNLTWEKQNKLDIGANLGFFNDRLIFDVDYYHNNINGLIQNVPISLTTGFSTVTANIGSMVNKGYEFAVTGYPVKSKDFSWRTSFNIALNTNTVTALYNNLPFLQAGTSFDAKVGKDIQTWNTPLYAGVDPANGNALWYTDATKTTKTANYNLAARVDSKQADPKAFGGFNNTFTYKGFSLTGDFYYSFGNYIRSSGFDSDLTDGNQPTFNKFQYDYLNRWTTPGQITNVPKYQNGGITYLDQNGVQQSNLSNSFSSRFLYNGSFIRLKNLTLGYDFKNIALLKSLGISKLYIYGRGTNLWTQTYDKALPVDPEVGVGGVGNLEVPQVKTFTIGLNVGL